MQLVHERVFVGNESSCIQGTPDLAVVHACKSPCHQRAVGYTGNLPNTHSHYLVLEQGNDLYLNIIDPAAPLFMPPLFSNFLTFSANHWRAGRKLLIHCNQGESRAPSLALLFLSKGLSVLSDSSFQAARKEFASFYPRYSPGKGIETYLTKNWDSIGKV